MFHLIESALFQQRSLCVFFLLACRCEVNSEYLTSDGEDMCAHIYIMLILGA